MKDRLRNQSAFTLMEIMIIVAVLASIATVAFPSVQNQIKKIRSEEGISALSALYMAQKSFYQDTGAYASSTASLAVTIPTMQNFNSPTVYPGTTSTCGGSSSYPMLASVADVNSEYILYVLADGRVVCTPCAGICLKLGFSAW